jgi:hypothetical protein
MHEGKFEYGDEGRKMYAENMRSKELYISRMKNEILMASRHARVVAVCLM